MQPRQCCVPKLRIHCIWNLYQSGDYIRKAKCVSSGKEVGAAICSKSADSLAPGCRRDVWNLVVSLEGIKQPLRQNTTNFITPFERGDMLLYCEIDRRHKIWIRISGVSKKHVHFICLFKNYAYYFVKKYKLPGKEFISNYI